MPRPGRWLLLAAISAGIWAGACDRGEREGEKAAPPEGVQDGAPPPAKKEVPQAIKDLQARIQPPGIPAPPEAAQPPAPPDGDSHDPAGDSHDPAGDSHDPALVASAEKLGSAFLEALAAGDREKARGLVFSSGDFERAVSPGHRQILEAAIVAQNDLVVEKLAEALAGKSPKSVWKPGQLAMGARGVFQEPLPIISNAALEVDADGVPITIRLDQMVHHGGAWKIFRLSLP